MRIKKLLTLDFAALLFLIYLFVVIGLNTALFFAIFYELYTLNRTVNKLNNLD